MTFPPYKTIIIRKEMSILCQPEPLEGFHIRRETAKGLCLHGQVHHYQQYQDKDAQRVAGIKTKK